MFKRSGAKRLEERRIEALSSIRGERVSIEEMAQRPRGSGDVLHAELLDETLKRLSEIEEKAKEARNIDDLNDLIDDAEQQGRLRAYICPIAEIADEGRLAIDVIEEWSVPKTVITKLRNSLGQKIERADKEPELARAALRALFEEYDSWSSYTDDYEDTMQRFTRWLFVATIVMPVLAIIAFRWPTTFLGGFLFAGAAGSCVSVMAKMPMLEVSLSGDLEAYGRRILSRIAAGLVGSIIGCALLAWGLFPISIQNQTFSDLLNACNGSSCSTMKTLVLLGVPMLFGFSERALTSFEQKIFGASDGSRTRRR